MMPWDLPEVKGDGLHGEREETAENGNIHPPMEHFLNSYNVPGKVLGAGI